MSPASGEYDWQKEASQFAEEAFRLGFFSIDLQSQATYWSPGLFRLFGLESQNFLPSSDFLTERIDHRDQSVANQLEVSIRLGTPSILTRGCLLRRTASAGFGSPSDFFRVPEVSQG